MFSDKFRVAILKVLGSYMFFKQNFKSVVILVFEIMIFFKVDLVLKNKKLQGTAYDKRCQRTIQKWGWLVFRCGINGVSF